MVETDQEHLLRGLVTFAAMWGLFGALVLGSVAVAASSAPVLAGLEDRALRDTIQQAPYTSRDIMVTRTTAAAPHESAAEFRDGVSGLLRPEIADAVEVAWPYQRTQLAVGFGGTAVQGGALTGPGVTAQPELAAPVLSFHGQAGLIDDITVVEGTGPATDPDSNVIDVIVEVEVAATLGVAVGGEYVLHPGQVRLRPDPAPPGPSAHVITGLFVANDAGSPIWQHPPVVPLRTHEMHVPPWTPFDDPVRVLRAGVITDDGGFTRLATFPLVTAFGPETGVRIRLDPDRIDASWVPGGRDAVLAMHVDPRLSHLTIDTGLPPLLAEFDRQALAVRAIAMMTATGVVGTGLGLAGLAAWLLVDLRRAELLLATVAVDEVVPVMAGPSVSRRGDLSVRFDGVDYRAEVVAEIPDGAPVLGGPGDWVIVPAQALPRPATADGILVAGAPGNGRPAGRDGTVRPAVAPAAAGRAPSDDGDGRRHRHRGGAATPVLLSPALGLDVLTGGEPLVIAPTVTFGAAVVVLLLVLVVVGVSTQATVNRSRRSREVLRGDLVGSVT